MMEFANEGGPLCSSDRIMPLIGPNHQVTMPPLKQSARIASLEFINRDQWYACGLPVPIMHIAARPSLRKKMSRSPPDQDKSLSFASTSNSRTTNNVQLDGVQHHHHHHQQQEQQQQISAAADLMANKDANSCASSSKETCQQAWKKEESSSLTLVDAFKAAQSAEEQKRQATMVAEDLLPGVSGQSELKSSITSVVNGVSIVIKKRKKRRSCWQTLKRKGNNKKAKIEKGKFGKRWSGSLHSEVGEASWQGSAEGYDGEGGESFGRILPGGQPDLWSEEEVAGFTLALYLFDKDFCAIKRFLETKKMKDILHFYYGKFYGTPAFCRWAGSKNSRNRKCVHGPRILQGWRQDDLLRRLLPHFPDAAMDVIPQAVKAFNERELTVEGLATELKAAVGLEVLVHCVGIGIPKRDLTAVHGDPARHGNHHLAGTGVGGGPTRVESTAALTAGKACSTLSKEEILECLTGDFRISKTRAQDLFWEAVWPRLLANGWHSMECEIPGSGGSKSTLVFLRPEVTKIARGSSERGVHYFGSASEVLKAVASDPGLLDGADGADELTGSLDTLEGSENQEDEDEEDEEEEEGEEDVQEEWSDDMFETLDMHRLRRPRARKTGGRVKSAKVAFKAAPSSSSPSSQEHAAQDSSESSSVDIDLNRPLSVVSSKPLELPNGEEVEDAQLHRSSESVPAIVSHQHHHRFSIEEIDLNLPPLDLDCNSPVGTTEEDGEVPLEQLHTAYTGPLVKCSSPISISKDNAQVLDSKTWDPCPVVMPIVVAASIEMGSTRLMGTINLNDPLPSSDMMVQEGGLDSTEQSRLVEQELFSTGNAGWRSIWPGVVEQVPSDKNSGDKASPLLHKKASCRCVFADSCKCQSRKRVFSHQESDVFAPGADYGKKLVPVLKKRAITYNLPVRLNGLHTPNFIFSMHVATMNLWSRLGIQPLPGASSRRREWNIRVFPSVVPFPVQENFSGSMDSQLPKCKVVELEDDVDAVNTESDEGNQASEGHVQKTLSTRAPFAGQWGNVKRLRCHFSETEPPVSSSYSRSKLQRLPRKYTISFDSRSGKNRLLKAKERCSDWSWAQNGRSSKSVVDTVSCCSTSHQFSSADSPEHQCASEKSQQEVLNAEELDDRLQWSKSTEFDYRRKPVDEESLWENTAELRSHEKSDREGTAHAKSLPKDWKVPCLTLTAPGDSGEFSGFKRQMPRSRGFRSHSRSHSQILPAKSIDGDFLTFSTGTKRFPDDLEELETFKKTKTDTSYSSRNREMTEEDLLITLCSMQEQKFESGIISGEVTPQLKGKRSSRNRRRNFSFMKFIFDGCEEEDEEEELEEELFVQPCTSQGPWQPTLPTTERIMRSPKLRRRRSGLPSKISCVVTTTSPVVPGSKGFGSSLKGQSGSRLSGQNASGEEESTAALNWPVHDIRFSLRKQPSDGSSRTDRLNGRKVPARWNQYPVC